MTLMQVVIIFAGNTKFVLYNRNLECPIYLLTRGFIRANIC